MQSSPIHYRQLAPEVEWLGTNLLGEHADLYRDFHDLLGFWLPNGLALSGGAQDGAWQAGFLSGLVDALVDLLRRAQASGVELRSRKLLDSLRDHPRGAHGVVEGLLSRLWRSLAGVSVGSINAAALALGWAPSRLRQLWLSIDTPDVLTSWAPGWFPPVSWARAFWKGSAKSAEPLRALLTRELAAPDAAIQPRTVLRVGTVSLEDGQFYGGVALGAGAYAVYPPERSATIPLIPDMHNLVSWIMASCAHPLLLPTELLQINGHWHRCSDGGVLNKTPVREAAESGGRNILALVASAPPQPEPLTSINKVPPKAHNLLSRSLREFELILREAHRDDLTIPEKLAGFYGPLGLHSVQPSWALPSELMNFSPTQSRKLVQLGEHAARSWIAQRGAERAEPEGGA